VAGFTLPGTPAVIVGSNTHVAWGFTNSYGDWADFVRVRWTDAQHTRYRSPLGERAVAIAHESIVVKGQPPVDLPVRETLWGPILVESNGTTADALALRWSAHVPGSLNLRLGALAYARDLDSALAAAGGFGMPAQNLVIADSTGRIAWRVTGQVPHRVGSACDAGVPLDPSTCAWQGPRTIRPLSTRRRDGCGPPTRARPTARAWRSKATRATPTARARGNSATTCSRPTASTNARCCASSSTTARCS
jgi:penicillin amidase